MDSITQGLLGGVVAQAALKSFSEEEKTRGRRLYWAGVLGGMAPDLDIFIRSSSNPLLALEFHRHFTHSLSFIPLGGLIVALFLWLFWKNKIQAKMPGELVAKRNSFVWLYAATTIGYATHGLLDACTSYGTMLFWPWNHSRVAWNNVSIIDPIFTGLLLLGFVWGMFSLKNSKPRIFLLLALAYLGFGFWQNHQGQIAQQALAQARGHHWERGRVHPGFGNLFLWRSIYESEDRLYVDSFRLIPGKDPELWEGGSLEKFDYTQINPPLPKGSVLEKDILLYAWFSDDYLAQVPGKENEVGDLRFGLNTDSLLPLWGFYWDPNKPDQHVERRQYESERTKNLGAAWQQLKTRLFKGGGLYLQIPEQSQN
ncbi:MAG: metal-dependent hydrolase [Deltaproteobacteria bacterium]|nr:metal-dependent hydrolase [Deltaproteobacteria bacterium]